MPPAANSWATSRRRVDAHTDVCVSRRALVVYVSWDGHQPGEVAKLMARSLRGDGFYVALADSLAALSVEKRLRDADLLVPHWTMGRIDDAQLNPALNAVREGRLHVAGCHGGM